MDKFPETIRIAATGRSVSLGAGELVGVEESLNFEGTVNGLNSARFEGMASIRFLRGWEIEEEYKSKLWESLDAEPSDTLGSLSHHKDAEYYCYCNVAVQEEQFGRLVAETRAIYGTGASVECSFHFVAREVKDWDEPLKHGVYPIVGWEVWIRNPSSETTEKSSSFWRFPTLR